MKEINKTHGFSLVEMLVVLAILGILAAASIPQYLSYVARSQSATVLQYAVDVQKEVKLCFQLNLSLTNCSAGAHGIRAITPLPSFTDSMTITSGVIEITTDYVNGEDEVMAIKMEPSINAYDYMFWDITGTLCDPDDRGVDCTELN